MSMDHGVSRLEGVEIWPCSREEGGGLCDANPGAGFFCSVRRFDEHEKPPNGGQTQQVEIQIARV